MAYERDVLDQWDEDRAAARRPPPAMEAAIGLVVVHRASGFRGAVLRTGSGAVELRAGDGTVRLFRLDSPFLHEGRPVTLVEPKRRSAKPEAPTVTASGSVKVRHQAKVARGGRLLVEGVHDAALVERVWGDDLRHEGVVVERLDGIDHLAAWIEDFEPGPGRRLGVLVDHLVPGSKEARLAEAVRHPYVLVTGTPFVDVWQAVRPKVLGIEAWPVVPRGTDWKTGIGEAFGEPDLAALWRRLLGSVRSYADLEPTLVGAVERLIDFVTADPDEPD